ncbi:MAG: hypothetical protein KGJ02_04345 [Verrucomicrobiota bacterium]|nr:hypothetical protein [Verrucomicrobiota bacterium]
MLFVFFSVICTNVANVYSASVGWEMVAPQALVGRKEYLILGLGLTTIFILVSDVFSPELLLHIADYSLVNLCLVLILGFLMRKSMRSAPGKFEQWCYFSAWLTATATNALQFLGVLTDTIDPLSVGMSIILGISGFSFAIRRMLQEG